MHGDRFFVWRIGVLSYDTILHRPEPSHGRLRAASTVKEPESYMSDSFATAAGPGTSSSAASLAPILQMLSTSGAVADEYGLSDPTLRAAYHAQILMILAGAYAEVFGTDVESPDWVPYIPYYLARAAPNPDTVYAFAPIDPGGVYRISGVKGTETIAAITLRKGGAHLGVRSGARVGEIDFSSVDADASGRFAFLLSAQRPPGESSQWFELHPETTCLMLRRVTKDSWQVDGRCGIERLDRPRARLALSDAQIADRMATVARYALSQNQFLLGYLRRLRQLGAEKNFVLDDQSGYGGLIVQSHYFHLFAIEPDEALIIESELPGVVKYWSVQVINPLVSTIDYALHQSALNDHQARTDKDGRVRMVLSVQDPQVPNWLDTGAWQRGGIQWRWNEVDVAPHPTVTKIKFRDVRSHLPADTPHVSAEARHAALSARAAHYQFRCR
jgi:hypothetical protein